MKPLAKSRPRPRRTPTPREIYGYLDTYVVGQEAAKRAVATAAYNHLKRCGLPPGEKKLLRKSNLLLIGPTGAGKTHLGRKLAECLDLPLCIVDATEYTEAGYYGKDIEVMIAELLFRANQSVEDAERGIIFIDEIDKLARRTQSYKTGGGNRDIGGEGVQQGLLKLLEGREVLVPMNLTQHAHKHEYVQLDTSDILFIAAGTFSDLHDYHSAGRAIGFGGSASVGGGEKALPPIGSAELLNYGMLAELLGRLPVRVQLAPLSEAELCAVLTGPPDALLREYQQLLAMDEVTLQLEDGALRELAAAARRELSGARGLRSLFERVLAELMFEAPERRGETVRIDRDYVRSRLTATPAAIAP